MSDSPYNKLLSVLDSRQKESQTTIMYGTVISGNKIHFEKGYEIPIEHFILSNAVKETGLSIGDIVLIFVFGSMNNCYIQEVVIDDSIN